MKEIYLISSFFLILLIQVCAAQTTCSDPDCSSQSDEAMLPDPEDCHQYYLCLNKNPIGPIDCPPDYFFNITKPPLGECVPADGFECKPCGSGGGKCEFECGADTIYVVDRYDCSAYHTCPLRTQTYTDAPTAHTELRCEGDKPYFDGEKCQDDRAKCCNCHPYCYKGESGGVKVPDPTDCTQYYYCIKESQEPTLQGHCAEGNFDVVSHVCSTSAPCSTLCTNLPGEDGCIAKFICESSGYFAACPEKCDPRYYYCSITDVGSPAPPKTCGPGLVFNPSNSQCVQESACTPTWF